MTRKTSERTPGKQPGLMTYESYLAYRSDGSPPPATPARTRVSVRLIGEIARQLIEQHGEGAARQAADLEWECMVEQNRRGAKRWNAIGAAIVAFSSSGWARGTSLH